MIGVYRNNKNKGDETMEIKEIRKPNYFKCKICGREFYVPYNVYTVNCPCGSTGYSEKIMKK